MKKHITKIVLAAAIAAGTITGCKKDKDLVTDPNTTLNERELITTVKLLFTDSANTSNIASATFKDIDGDGGSAPTLHETIKLQANKTYLVGILLLNESKNPIDTISHEVKKEANDHLFFYKYTTVDIKLSYLDFDTNKPPLPLGITTKWKTGSAGNGTSRVILKHQPGTKNGTEAPGETDVDILFQTIVQ